MAAIPDDMSIDPAVVDVNVTQPWLSTKATRRRRFCHRSEDVRETAGGASFAPHDKDRHYIKKERPHLCATHDPHISRRPSQFCRKNGFDRPLNALQILSWVFFAVIVIVGCVLIIPALATAAGATFGALFILSAVGVFGVALAVTQSDPADPLIFEPPDSEIITQLDPYQMAVCDLCGPTNIKSKHCRACNKCVGNFDHHCKWLNNCIGQANYKLFLLLIVLVGILATLVLAFGVVVIVEEAVYHRVEARFAANMGSWNAVGYFIGLGLLMVLSLALLCLDLQLVALHAYLVKEGITTFEYITQRVQQPKAEAADVKEPNKACCAEWIVIDRRRLKRARARLSAKAEGAEERTSQLDDPGGPASVIIEIPDVPPLTKGPSLFHSTSLSNQSDVADTVGIISLTPKEPKVAPSTYDTQNSGAVVRPIPLRDFLRADEHDFEFPTAPSVPHFVGGATVAMSSSASSVAGFAFEDELEEDPPPEASNEPKTPSDATTAGHSHNSDRALLKAHRLPAPSVASTNFDCKIRFLDLQRAVTQQPVGAGRPDSVRRWARLLSSPTGGGPPKLPDKRAAQKESMSRRLPHEQDAYSTRTVVMPRRPQTTRGCQQPLDVFRFAVVGMPDPDICVVSTDHSRPLDFMGDCFTSEVNCRDILRPSLHNTIGQRARLDPRTIKVYPRAEQYHHI